MTFDELRLAYYDIKRRNEQLQRDHAVLFDGCSWQTIDNTEQRIGCDGYKLIVAELREGVVTADVLDPKGKAIASYR